MTAALLLRYLRPQLGRAALLLGLVLGGIGLQLAAPQAIRLFLDAATAGGAQRDLLGLALLFLLLSVLERAATFAAVLVGERLGWDAINALRDDLLRHILACDMRFHKRHTPGELIERTMGDVDSMGNFFSRFVVDLLGNGLLLVGVLALLFAEDLRVGLALGGYIGLTLLAMLWVQRRATARFVTVGALSAEQFGFLEERLLATEDLRANGAVGHTMRQFSALLARWYRAEIAATLVGTTAFILTEGLLVIGYALGLGLGAWLYLSGQATIGAAFVLVYYIGRLAAPLNALRRQAEDFQHAAASARRIADLLAERSGVDAAPSAAAPAVWIDARPSHILPASPVTRGPASLDFAGVTFGYHDDDDDGRDALIDVSFALAAGERLGVLGRTGSGKTTIGRLVSRLYDPQRGQILLGGADLRALTLPDLRASIAVVTQDVQLFSASVRENVRLFDRAIGDPQILAALAELGLDAWLARLPQGLDTPIGAGGLGLSAGEAQLLAFARALLRDPALVILDEASSRLDPATERLLDRAVERLLRGRTALIIAHRLRTLERVDHILVLEDGRALEFGARAALAGAVDSRYAALLEADA